MKRRLLVGLAIPVIIGMTAVGGAIHSPSFHTFAAASTPPPPPTFIPTPIGPPPTQPTNTPTATPIPPTATPTATSAPLGAPVRIVASTSVKHQGKTALVHWRMAYQLGIKGFRIYAGQRNLTHSLIKPHHSPNYSHRVPWTNGGHYTLNVLFKNGHAQKIAIH